jgi:spore coat protein U-like protein
MKKLLAITAAVAVMAMAGSAFAATQTTTVAVSASITGSCTVTSAGTIAYGALDPLAGGAVTPTVTQPVVKCTNGMPVAITDDMGVNEVVSGTAPPRMKANTTDFIAYAFAHAATANGAGPGTALNINLTAPVLPLVNYQNSAAGSYADTITLTMTF